MVYRPRVDDKLCFVLMPFGQPFDSYYEKIIKPAASDAGLATLRSDEIRSTKAIINDIWKRLWVSRVVVADVSTRNPNVNYELGLCDALGVPTIIITGKIEDVPFDYKHIRCILYNRAEAGCDDKLRKDLVATMRAVLAEVASEDQLKWPYDTSVFKEPVSGSLLASADSRGIVIQGANIVRAAIASAFGPHGTSVAISQTFGATAQLNRGVQIARGIKSLNPLEEKGIEQVRDAAASVFNAAGDCTKLVAILTAGFMTRGQELIERGFHPKDVVESLTRSVERVLTHFVREVIPIVGDGIDSVAVTAASGDVRVGAIVTEAIRRAGKDGIVTIETSDQDQTTLEVVEGTVFDQGYLSEYFVTDAETSKCLLENCAILLHQGPIQSMRDLLPLLEQVAKTDTSLLVVAGNIEGEALSTLTVNKLRGTLRCAAVKAPGHADRRKALMEDIAVLTGSKFFSDDLGVPLKNVRPEDLGRAERVIVTRNDTTIVGGAGSTKAIQDRIRAVQAQIEYTSNTFEREKLQDRLAKLAGRLAVLKAGGLSEADRAQEKYRLESALYSAGSAIEHGGVVGGGIALFRAGLAMMRAKTETQLDIEVNRAVESVLEEPVQQLITNANKSPTEIFAEILDTDSPHWGFDAKSCQVEDLLVARVLDAARPIELSLRVALSHAASVLQTGTWDLSTPPTPQQR
jgi:chaperonin GroEL